MKLEEEIKQGKFKSETHKLAVNILYTSGWFNAFMTSLFKPYGISSQQYNVLRILKGQNSQPISMGAIQERMLDKQSNATRLVEKLLKKDLVKREWCSQDRRQAEITITQAGMALLSEMEVLDDASDSKLDVLDMDEQKQLNFLLDKLRG